MGDVHNDKIVGVAENGKTMNVWWTNSATEIYWNNAIIMASSIARTISTGTLWDGYIHNKEKIPYFYAKPFYTMFLGDVNDELTFVNEEPINISYKESIPAFYAEPFEEMTVATIEEYMPNAVSSVIEVGALSDTEVYVELSNPIQSADLDSNLAAFTVYATFASGRLEVAPTAIERLGTSEFKLTVSSLDGATGEVGIIYNSAKGDLYDCAYDEKVTDFSKAFTYSTDE